MEEDLNHVRKHTNTQQSIQSRQNSSPKLKPRSSGSFLVIKQQQQQENLEESSTSQTGTLICFFKDQCYKTNSPIVSLEREEKTRSNVTGELR